MRIALAWAANVIALLVVVAVNDDVEIDPLWRAVTVGAVFGVVNGLVKPIVKVLALPVIVITLGIALFFVNLLMLYLTSWLSPALELRSFGGAIGATIVLWIVNGILHAVFGIGRHAERRRR